MNTRARLGGLCLFSQQWGSRGKRIGSSVHPVIHWRSCLTREEKERAAKRERRKKDRKGGKERRRNLQANIPDEHRCKIIKAILAKRIQHTSRRSFSVIWWIHPREARIGQHLQVKECHIPHQKNKVENYTIPRIHAKKSDI
jgi:hypothetical protein